MTPSNFRAIAPLFMVLSLAACTAPLPSGVEARSIGPNANLFVQGIPAVPAALVAEVDRYTNFRGRGLVDWHPTRRELLVSHRRAGTNTSQLYRLTAPMAPLEQLTDLPEPITQAAFEPLRGDYLVYLRSSGGDEAYQLWRLDLATRQHQQFTESTMRHSIQGWIEGRDGQPSRLLVGSLPLDRTAEGGTRARVETLLRIVDPLAPQRMETVATLPGGGWSVADVSPDQRKLLLSRSVSATNSEIWVMDLPGRERHRLLPLPGGPAASLRSARFAADGQSVLATADTEGEFRELMRWGFDGRVLQRVTRHIPWDVGGLTSPDDGRVLALQANEDGIDRLHLFDGRTLAELPRPVTPAGNVVTAAFHRQRPELAFTIVNAQGPSQIYTLDVTSGRHEQWTRAEAPAGVDTAAFQPQQLVRWRSFDGRMISGWMSWPPARFAGRRPVLIDIHGGPASQAQAGFLGRWQYFVQELGVAIIRPNVRGSSGYGKTFLDLDNGMLREDSVKDIAALLDWIAQQPGLDASRVAVMGGSYGGYMSLAVAAHHADRIAGAIDDVGISHFVTFLESTESYRRDLRRTEYGDERDPRMREFLHRISPLTNAHRITKPLFVIQGRNDPRVPYTEAEQIVAKVRSNGTPVWYLRAENEGHGFARKENADFQFYAMTMFLRRTLRL